MNPLRINILSQSKIEQYANTYERDKRLFVKEENSCSSQLRDAERKAKETRIKIESLGEKSDPGEPPEYEPYVKPLCTTVGWIWGISVLLVFILHCIIWIGKLLFDISWDTWGWTKTCFMYGLYLEIICFLGGSAIYGLVYWIWYGRLKAYNKWCDELDSLESELSEITTDINKLKQSLSNITTNRLNILAYAYKLVLGLPVRSIGVKDLDKAHRRLFEFLDHRESINCISNPTEKLNALMDFYDRKLTLFYNFSVPSEATSPDVLIPIKDAIVRLESTRGNLDIPEAEEKNIKNLARENSKFLSTSLDSKIDEFQKLIEMDTKGIFTKHDSKALEQQVTGLNEVFKSSIYFYNSYDKVIKKINTTLGIVRLIAYRNIYLGAELLNVVREGSGGGKLTTAFDSIDNSVDISTSKIEIESFNSSSAIGEMLSAGLNSITKSVQNVLDDKKSTMYAAVNPKLAALAVAGVAASAIIEKGIQAWKKRNAKIDGLLKQEEELINKMDELIDSYLKNLSSSKRALELIKAIVKANEGFMAIYYPLSKKVFMDRSINLVSMVELRNLTLAIGEYKKISDSKL